MADDAAYKKRLTRRLAELEGRLHEIEDELDEPVAADSEDRATEREGDEVLESLGEAGLMEIRQINAALARIEDGTYGECAVCGKQISDERLDAVPHTNVCRKCA